MRANRSMPTSTVIPVLADDDVEKAVDWLCDAFGFVERLRIGSHRAQLRIGDGAVAVTGGGGAGGVDSPDSVMVRVDDVDAHHARASERGALILGPPTDYSSSATGKPVTASRSWGWISPYPAGAGADESVCQRPNSLPEVSLQIANQPIAGTGIASSASPPSSRTWFAPASMSSTSKYTRRPWVSPSGA